MKSEAQKIVDRAKLLIKGNPWLEDAWHAAWSDVLDAMKPLYKAVRPVMKNYEVHHCNETIRLAMLTKLVSGGQPNEAVQAAIEKGREILAQEKSP